MSKRFSDYVKREFNEDQKSKKDYVITNTMTITIKKNIDLQKYCSNIKNIVNIYSPSIDVVMSCIEMMLNIELKEVFGKIKGKKLKWVDEVIKNNNHTENEEKENKIEIKKIFSKKFSLRDVLEYFSKNRNNIIRINNYARIHDTGFHYSDDNKKKNIKVKKNIIKTIKSILTENIPVITVINIPKNYEKSKTGILHDKEIYFKHPVIIVGYSDNLKSFIFQNNWGKKWGDNGFGYIPYKIFIKHKILDTWIITSMETDLVEDLTIFPKTTNLKIKIP